MSAEIVHGGLVEFSVRAVVDGIRGKEDDELIRVGNTPRDVDVSVVTVEIEARFNGLILAVIDEVVVAVRSVFIDLFRHDGTIDTKEANRRFWLNRMHDLF